MLLGAAIATHFGNKTKEAAHRHVAIAGRAFRQVADLPLGLQGLSLNIATENAHPPAAGGEKTAEHLHGGGFTGAIGAEKTQHLARLHLKRQVIDSRVLSKTFTQVVYFNHGLYPRDQRPSHAAPALARPARQAGKMPADYKESAGAYARP